MVAEWKVGSHFSCIYFCEMKSLVFALSPLWGWSHSFQSLRGFCFPVLPPSINCLQRAGAGRVNLHFPHSLPQKNAQRLVHTAASLVPLCKGKENPKQTRDKNPAGFIDQHPKKKQGQGAEGWGGEPLAGPTQGFPFTSFTISSALQ